ncbi:TonB-dependent receptor [Mariniphaga anaerophila]|nr:TonB-dependent receptor [Mariniphaga anaerophila]
MKLTIFVLLFSTMLVSASVYSQNTRLTMQFSGIAYEQFFKEVEKQTEYRFAFSNSKLDPTQTINVDVTNETLDQILDEKLPYGISYEIIDRYVVILNAKEKNSKGRVAGNVEQGNTVSGKVTDTGGQPLPGVTVVVKGTTQGTVTNADGEYSLANIPEAAVLQFSFVGMKMQEVATENRSNINVVMEEETIGLEEVVAIGYGTMRKANLTGAVDQITNDVFENRSVSNVTQALQGVVPNLNISLEDGKPGRSASYNIRGTTSIGQGGSALVLIDGVEGDPALLNPNDVESVSVLKDAASAAIYGARASFGVVLISTKKALKEKTSINYTGNFSVQSPTTTPDFVSDGYIWAERFREAYYGWYNYSSLPSKINTVQSYSDAWLETFKQRKEQGVIEEVVAATNGDYIYYGNTDWYDLLYKNQVLAQDHNITISGGSDKSDFYISGRIYDYGGLYDFNPDTYQMLNIRAKGSLQIFDWLKVTNNMEFSNMKYHIPITVSEYGYSIQRIIEVDAPPVATVYNPDGTLTRASSYAVGDFIYGKNAKNTYKKVLRNTTGFTAKFLEDKLRINGDFTFRDYENDGNRKRVQVPYSTSEGVISYTGTKYNDYLETFGNTIYTATNLYAEFENTFDEDHYFKGMAGYNYETSKYNYTSVQRNGLLLEDAESLNLSLGESITTSASYNKWRIAAGFFRLNYGYKNRYLVEVNGRYDGSSKFPDAQQFAFFPSISAGWRISEEPFWKINKDAISDVKMRASYGSLGNGNVSPYSFQELLSISTSSRVINGSLNKYTRNPAVIPNSLTWETSTTSDFGLDFGLMKGKLRFSGDYYVRKTTDMYTVGVTLPDVFGATSPKGNYADMTTKGWELSLTWNDSFTLADKPFHYKVRATLHDYSSTIDRYNNATNSLSDYYEGMKIGEIWGYKTDGLFQSEAETEGYVNTIIKTSNNGTTYPGDLKFMDLNNNKKIDYGDNTVDNPGDKRIIGNESPRYIYSFTFNGDWNSFFFSAFFQGVGKQDWFPSKESSFWGQYNRPYNSLPSWHINNYWTEDNPDAYLPRYAGYNRSLGYGNTITDRYLQNVAYIRLKNLQIGYTLPKHWVSKVKMQNARVYITGENLWCWSPLYKRTKDFDVTNAISGTESDLSSNSMGDGNSYPIMRSISFGLSLTF